MTVNKKKKKKKKKSRNKNGAEMWTFGQICLNFQ